MQACSAYLILNLLRLGLRCRFIPDKHPVQTMALAYWSFHYSKRIFETFLVHR